MIVRIAGAPSFHTYGEMEIISGRILDDIESSLKRSDSYCDVDVFCKRTEADPFIQGGSRLRGRTVPV